jgi:hypothetical protein
MIWLEALLGCMVSAGVMLLHDALELRRHRLDLVDRLAPYQPQLLAEEAETWLKSQT